MTVKGPGKDLHSGVFGGTVHEPMTDLVQIMSKLVGVDGKILIPGIYDDVAPVTSTEDALYAAVDFSLSDIENAIDAKNVIHDNEKAVLMSRWVDKGLF